MLNLSSSIQKEFDITATYIDRYRNEEKNIFVSSSFQSHSIPLLHILSQIDSSIPVYFLETGFHFPETLTFRDEITELLGLDLRIVESAISKNNQRDQKGRFHFCSNTDYCCHLNKILPLEPVLLTHDIWITGVRADQNSNRANLSFEAEGKFGTTRFHPMLNWTSKMIWEYRDAYDLPAHPLEAQGYLSIGCAPCTQKFNLDEREGRWAGQKKNECGLHTDLIK